MLTAVAGQIVAAAVLMAAAWLTFPPTRRRAHRTASLVGPAGVPPTAATHPPAFDALEKPPWPIEETIPARHGDGAFVAVLNRLERLDRLGRLNRSGRLRMPPAVFSPLAIVGLGMVVTVLAGAAAGVAAGVLVAAGWSSARDVLRQRAAARILEVDLAACESLVAELQSGAPLHAALRASANGAGPLPAALRQAAAAVGLGGRPAEVLIDSRSATARQLGAVLAVSLDRGIAPAAAIDALRADLAYRRDHRERLTALLAGPSSSAALLAGLPILGLLMGEGMGADPFSVLLGTTPGGIALVAGAALTAVGLVWSRRIVTRAREAA